MAYSVGTAIGLAVLGLLSARKLRAMSLRTITDYLAIRYNSRVVRGLCAGLSIVAVTGIVAAQVNAAGGTLAILGIDPTMGAVVAVSLFIAYVVLVDVGSGTDRCSTGHHCGNRRAHRIYSRVCSRRGVHRITGVRTKQSRYLFFRVLLPCWHGYDGDVGDHHSRSYV